MKLKANILHSLFINTATRLIQLSVWKNNQCLKNIEWETKLDEAERLLPEIESLLISVNLTKHDIHRLICCTGPAGFTSIRIGVSAINAWSYAANIPVATVSVFDLYPPFPSHSVTSGGGVLGVSECGSVERDTLIFVNANLNETWIKHPHTDPTFVTRTDLKLPASFSYSGEIREDWKQYLTDLGGTPGNVTPSLTTVTSLDYRHRIVEPLYFKDANITWSPKNKATLMSHE